MVLTTLSNFEAYTFCLEEDFKIPFLAPVGRYVSWKLANFWDDYNELYHATAYFLKISEENEIWTHSHLIIKNGEINGVAFIVGGKLNKAESKFRIEEEEKSLLLKYFHITDRGKGLGKKWLGEIILPYYKAKDFDKIYVSSSHPESFPLYEKFGRCFHHYQANSDNHLYLRQGKSFEIELGSREF
ncbi:MAG: hypothetical protein U0W24_18035 [Bacteroidales bacterium]